MRRNVPKTFLSKHTLILYTVRWLTSAKTINSIEQKIYIDTSRIETSTKNVNRKCKHS